MTKNKGGYFMFCSYCGTNNPDGTAYCSNCGGPLTNQAPQQPYTPAPAPYYPAATPTHEQPAKGLSIASLVLGIVSLFVFAYIAGSLAIVFSCMAKKKGSTSKMNTAGLVLGIIGIAAWLVMQIFLGSVLYSII